MSLMQMLLGAAAGAVMRGRFGNVTSMGAPMFAAAGTTGTVSGLVPGPANANRYVLGWVNHNNTVAMTIGGVTATMVSSGNNSEYFFYALVPTGSSLTINLTGLTSTALVRMGVYSAEATSAPTLTVASASTNTSLPAGTMTGTIPTNGFAVGWSIGGQASSNPTGPSINASFGDLQTTGPLAVVSNNYINASALSVVGSTGSITVTFTFANVNLVNTNMMLVA